MLNANQIFINKCKCRAKKEAIAKAADLILALVAENVAEDQITATIEEIERLLKLYAKAHNLSCKSLNRAC